MGPLLNFHRLDNYIELVQWHSLSFVGHVLNIHHTNHDYSPTLWTLSLITSADSWIYTNLRLKKKISAKTYWCGSIDEFYFSILPSSLNPI